MFLSISLSDLSICSTEALARPEVPAIQQSLLQQVLEREMLSESEIIALEQLRADAAECSRRFAVSADEQGTFANLVIAHVAATAFGNRLVAEGFDPRRIDSQLESTAAETLDALIARRFDDPGVVELIERILPLGDQSTPAGQRLLGAYTINAARKLRLNGTEYREYRDYRDYRDQ
ncbi:MAG: hypothetical protein ACT4OE_02650 [Sphingosinicella sp.]